MLSMAYRCPMLGSVLNPVSAPGQPRVALLFGLGCPCLVSTPNSWAPHSHVGPVIFTPLSPVTVVGLRVADYTTAMWPTHILFSISNTSASTS